MSDGLRCAERTLGGARDRRPPKEVLPPAVIGDTRLGECLGAVGVIVYVRDLAVSDGEHDGELTVELHAGKLLQGRVGDAQDAVGVVGDELKRTHLVLVSRGSVQPVTC